MEKPMIYMEHVTKKIGGNVILQDVNLNLEPGCVYGIEGTNGSGKTMLMRMIAGLIYPTQGKVLIQGKEISGGKAYPVNLGMLIENPAFLDSRSGFANLKLLAEIRNTVTDDDIRECIRRVGLDPDDRKKYKKYSLGMKQRLGIALALVGEPDLLILDEPINGLDPQGIVEVRETIQKLAKERGMTICISSHILEELSKIATDYGIIHNGCLVQELTREELMKKCSERIELTLDNPKQAIPVLDDMGFSNYQVIDKEHIHIFERLGESARLNMELAKAGIPVKGISITSEELENYFLRLTGGDNRA